MDRLNKLCVTRTLSWIAIAYVGAILMPIAIWGAMWLANYWGL